MNETVIAVIFAVLLVISFAQAVEISNLKQTDTYTPTGYTVQPQLQQAQQPAIPSNLQNLPDMVGGC